MSELQVVTIHTTIYCQGINVLGVSDGIAKVVGQGLTAQVQGKL
jgi:hypothetical protein